MPAVQLPGLSADAMRSRLQSQSRCRHLNCCGHGDEAPVLWAVMLEFHVLGAIHLVEYARWADAYGDIDILAKTVGIPTVYLETGQPGGQQLCATAGQSHVRHANPRSQCPSMRSPKTVASSWLTARSIAADLIADYSHARTLLLPPDGSLNYQSLEPGYQQPLRTWLESATVEKTAASDRA